MTKHKLEPAGIILSVFFRENQEQHTISQCEALLGCFSVKMQIILTYILSA